MKSFTGPAGPRRRSAEPATPAAPGRWSATTRRRRPWPRAPAPQAWQPPTQASDCPVSTNLADSRMTVRTCTPATSNRVSVRVNRRTRSRHTSGSSRPDSQFSGELAPCRSQSFQHPSCLPAQARPRQTSPPALIPEEPQGALRGPNLVASLGFMLVLSVPADAAVELQPSSVVAEAAEAGRFAPPRGRSPCSSAPHCSDTASLTNPSNPRIRGRRVRPSLHQETPSSAWLHTTNREIQAGLQAQAEPRGTTWSPELH